MASDRSILNIQSFNELTSENDSTAYADVCVPLPDNFNKAEGLKLVAVTEVKLVLELDPMQPQRVKKSRQQLHTAQNAQSHHGPKCKRRHQRESARERAVAHVAACEALDARGKRETAKRVRRVAAGWSGSARQGERSAPHDLKKAPGRGGSSRKRLQTAAYERARGPRGAGSSPCWRLRRGRTRSCG